MKYADMPPDKAAKLKLYLRERHKRLYVPKKDGTFKSAYRWVRGFNGHGVPTHIVIAGKILEGRWRKGYCVHHIDGNGLNNNHDNLVICPSSAYHMLLHKRQRALEKCGNANWLKCVLCGKWDDPRNMYLSIPKDQTSQRACHRECNNEYKRRKYAKGAVSGSSR